MHGMEEKLIETGCLGWWELSDATLHKHGGYEKFVNEAKEKEAGFLKSKKRFETGGQHGHRVAVRIPTSRISQAQQPRTLATPTAWQRSAPPSAQHALAVSRRTPRNQQAQPSDPRLGSGGIASRSLRRAQLPAGARGDGCAGITSAWTWRS